MANFVRASRFVAGRIEENKPCRGLASCGMALLREDICVQKAAAPTIYGPKSIALKKKSATPAALNIRTVSSCDISLRAEIGIVPDM